MGHILLEVHSSQPVSTPLIYKTIPAIWQKEVKRKSQPLQLLRNAKVTFILKMNWIGNSRFGLWDHFACALWRRGKLSLPLLHRL